MKAERNIMNQKSTEKETPRSYRVILPIKLKCKEFKDWIANF